MNENQHTILNDALNVAPSIIEETFRFTHRSLTKKYLYYYSSLETLVNGILVENPKPNNEVCIWATRWSHMNDKLEVKSGLDLLKNGNMPSTIIGFHEQYIEKLHVICFTENKDKLQMWNGYGKRGYGVMLAFDFKELLKYYPNLLKPCIYENTSTDKKIIKKIIDCDFSGSFLELSSDSKLIASFLCTLIFLSLHKDCAYSYEKEVRLTGIGIPMLSFPVESKYRVQDGLIIPYIPVYFPKSTLKQIWLGPCLEHERNKKILEEILKSKGFDTEILISKKPYRG